MTNAFDFHYIVVSSTRKTDMTKGGIRKSDIHGKVSYVTIYGKTYPRTRYEATVQFFDINGFDRGPEISMASDAWKSKCPGATVSVKYHCAD